MIYVMVAIMSLTEMLIFPRLIVWFTVHCSFVLQGVFVVLITQRLVIGAFVLVPFIVTIWVCCPLKRTFIMLSRIFRETRIGEAEIVHVPLVLVLEGLICEVEGLEHLLGLLCFVDVRVVLLRQAPESTLHFLWAGVHGHSKQIVVVGHAGEKCPQGLG